MYTVTYSIKRFNENNYELQIIESFADEVLKSSGNFIKELLEEYQSYLSQHGHKFQTSKKNVYEILLLGTLWRIYYNKTPITNKKHSLSWKIFKNINRKGTDSRNEYSNYNQENLKKLFKYLETTNEFEPEFNQLKYLKDFLKTLHPYKISKFLRDTIIFADWFKTSSKYTIGESTTNGEKFLYYIRSMGIEIINR